MDEDARTRVGTAAFAGAVNPRVRVNFDAQLLASRLMTMRGIHNYRPRHRIQALEFVMANRGRFLFKPIVDAKFPLREVGVAFKKASERAVMGAAIMP